MIVDRHRYPFLGRMRRPSGIAPKVAHDVAKRLGTTPQRVLEISFSLALLIVIVGFTFFPVEVGKKQIVMATREDVALEDVALTRQESRPPPPPRPPIPIEAPMAEVLDDVPIQSSEIDLAHDAPPPRPQQSEADEDEYFVAVEELPQLIGGTEGLMRRLEYPSLAIRAGIQGRVHLTAYVNEHGGVDRVTVEKGIGGGCDEAAVEALLKSRFVPGKQRGKPVKVRVAIAIRFNLRDATM